MTTDGPPPVPSKLMPIEGPPAPAAGPGLCEIGDRHRPADRPEHSKMARASWPMCETAKTRPIAIGQAHERGASVYHPGLWGRRAQAARAFRLLDVIWSFGSRSPSTKRGITSTCAAGAASDLDAGEAVGRGFEGLIDESVAVEEGSKPSLESGRSQVDSALLHGPKELLECG